MKYLSKLLYSYLYGAASTALKELPNRYSVMRAPKQRPYNRTAGFLLGVGTGVGIALLLAPKSGANTRSIIAKKTKEGTEYLKQQASDLSGSAADLLDKGIKEAARVGKQATEAAV